MKRLFFFALVVLIGCSEDFDVPNHVPGIVKIFDNKAFIAYGEAGLIITDIATDAVLTQIFPPRDMKSIDDFDVDGDLLFIIDARNKNYLASYSIGDINNPKLEDGPILVNGGPFNGVSANNGNLVVSGGTLLLEYFQYSSAGKLKGSVTFGRDRGHPDVTLSDNGQVAFVSTDFQIVPDKPRFGAMALHLGEKLSIPSVLSEYRIEGAGFSQGLTMPVGFPIKIKVHNDHLLVAHGGGLTIIELIENSAFGTVNTFDFEIEATAIATLNNTAYIVGYTPNGQVLMKIDLKDIDNLSVLETELLNIASSVPTSVAATNQFVFIAAGEAGLLKLGN
jgi:hypothetical protein